MPEDPAVDILEATDNAASQEADQQHKDDAEHQFPRRAESESRLQEILKEEPNRRANQRAEQRTPAADSGLHHELTRGVEGKGVRRHEGLQDAKQPAGEPGIGGSDHERRELVAMDVMADRRRAQRIIPDRAQDRADRGAHDPQRYYDTDEIAQREKLIERPAGGEVKGREAEMKARRRYAGQTVLAAGPVRERIELDKKEYFRDRHGDHGEVNAGAPQRD